VPLNTGVPTISGTAQVGQLLTGTVGSWTGTGPISYAQQWQRCSGTNCSTIAGATALTYTPVTADVGLTLRLQVTASNSGGASTPATSVATAAVSAAAGSGGVTDTFTRADALTLGPGWSITTRDGRSPSCLIAISSNQAAYPAGRAGPCDQYWTGSAAEADGVGSFTVTALPPDGGELDIEGRMQGAGSSSVVLYIGAWSRRTTGSDEYYIVRRNTTGNWTTLATVSGPDMAIGDQLAFKLAGSSLSVHRKAAGGSWVQMIATTDTAISGPGRFGLEFYNATGGKADDWTITPDLPGTVPPAVPVNTGVPTISGTAQVGQLLTGTVGNWTGTGPISYAQQWQRCNGTSCNVIAGATALTYTPVTADVGLTLRLQVTASNSGGASSPATSVATAAVSAAPTTVPLNTGVPTISGTAQVGQLLTGTVGSWTGTGPINYAQQWLRCSGTNCNTIAGATTLTYTPVTADVGLTLRLQVTASNGAGASTPATSAATPAVTAAPITVPVNTSVPAVLGRGNVRVGRLLTGTVGSWTGTGPISYSQQWLRCSGASCTAIAGATALSYTPVTADVGLTLRLQVTAANSAGAGTPATSAATATVRE
jgi:hypothetical protein